MGFGSCEEHEHLLFVWLGQASKGPLSDRECYDGLTSGMNEGWVLLFQKGHQSFAYI
jgi:hypothetical protein